MRLLKQAAGFAALILSLSLLVMATVATPAIALEATPAPSFVQELTQALVPAFGLVVTALVGWAVAMLKAKTGIDIEARHREALQSALTNGALLAMRKAGWLPGQPVGQEVLGIGRAYVESSVPDALKRFGIDPGSANGKATLDRLLLPHLPLGK